MQLKEISYQMKSILTNNQESKNHSASSVSDKTVDDIELKRRIRQQDSPCFISSVRHAALDNFYNGLSKNQIDQNSNTDDVNDNASNNYDDENIKLKCGLNRCPPLNINREYGHYSSEYYQIYIKVISGKTLALQVHKDFTIDDLKKNIEVREIVPADMQHIIYAGKQLLNGHTITHYSIHAGSTLHMSFYLRGGSTETIPGLIDLYISSRCEYPNINEFIDLNKYVLFEIGWDPVKIRKEWTKGLSKHGYRDRPNWQALKQEYDTYFKPKEFETSCFDEDTSD